MQLTIDELVCAAVLIRQYADDCHEHGIEAAASQHYVLAAKFYSEAGALDLAAECSGLSRLCDG